MKNILKKEHRLKVPFQTKYCYITQIRNKYFCSTNKYNEGIHELLRKRRIHRNLRKLRKVADITKNLTKLAKISLRRNFRGRS